MDAEAIFNRYKVILRTIYSYYYKLQWEDKSDLEKIFNYVISYKDESFNCLIITPECEAIKVSEVDDGKVHNDTK